jgi:tetratricopeptide (TPR) repeat protein
LYEEKTMKRQLERTFFLTLVIVGALAVACGGSKKNAEESSSGEGSAPGMMEEADQYMGQAGLALSEGKQEEALANYLAAAEVYDRDGSITVERAEAHFLAAGLAYELAERKQAISEYDKAVEIYLRFKGNSRIKAANALNNMGTIYKEMQNKARALNCWHRALEIYKKAPPELQDKTNIAKIEQNIRDLEQGF